MYWNNVRVKEMLTGELLNWKGEIVNESPSIVTYVLHVIA